MEKENMIAFCGLDCSKCDAYIATRNDNQALREKTAKLWSEMNNVTILPEQINCDGCKANGRKTVYCATLCEIRKCARRKGVATCGNCSKMAGCSTLNTIVGNCPEAMDNLKQFKI